MKLILEYNSPTSVHYPYKWIKMYAELIGNYKNIRIKNLMGNKLYLSTTYEHFNLGKQDEVKDRVKHINKL